MHQAADPSTLGVDRERWDYLVALGGNPNTGKSTVFNALTGLRQHTGNWPGKTVARAEGGYKYTGLRYKLVDLPGTYSLLATTTDEQIARDFILSGQPDVTVIVVDATRLERNLNLVLQVLQITDRVVVCLNLTDEARRHGLAIDERQLARDLGVPVVPTVARQGRGLDRLMSAVAEVAGGKLVGRTRRIASPEYQATREAALSSVSKTDGNRHGQSVEATYAEAARIAARAVRQSGAQPRFDLDRAIDRIVTSRIWGFPIMLLLLAGVFWITITGANVPSQLLGRFLLDTVHPSLRDLAVGLGMPLWLRGVLIDGMYLATAWVISVMLPPMAIFFPLFTLLEDFGYLPRIAFNLDTLFKRAGAHGKQALTMAMGFGCNAAGVIAARIIDSPRERLIAILTNNFALCNGRWPTQILIATIFLGTLVPARLAGVVSALAVVGVAILGVGLTFAVSWLLSRTVLRGEASAFSLELPPYRPPQVLKTLYRSVIDRTVYVLWRAVVFAMPAGAVIWIVANLQLGGISLAERLVDLLNPVGLLLGLNGVILLAYMAAIPANEIVVPTILMLTVLAGGLSGVGAGAGVMFQLESSAGTLAILRAGGWTLLTGVNLMLFSLLHNPCSTTIATIYKETGSKRWALISVVLPLGIGLLLTGVVAQLWRLVAA
ncbi:MAG TPA: ferrous iron transport protein B [Anaerolineales bacterium]